MFDSSKVNIKAKDVNGEVHEIATSTPVDLLYKTIERLIQNDWNETKEGEYLNMKNVVRVFYEGVR